MIERVIKKVPLLVKFLASGFPALVLAVVLNGFLVEKAKIPISAAYGIVLVIQTVINFFMCRFWVFDAASDRKLASSFSLFVVGILFIRLLDWLLYNMLTSWIGLFFLIAQGVNVVVFALVKFEFSRRLFVGDSRPVSVPSGAKNNQVKNLNE